MVSCNAQTSALMPLPRNVHSAATGYPCHSFTTSPLPPPDQSLSSALQMKQLAHAAARMQASPGLKPSLILQRLDTNICQANSLPRCAGHHNHKVSLSCIERWTTGLLRQCPLVLPPAACCVYKLFHTAGMQLVDWQLLFMGRG